jgi:hypothetical protein
MGRGLAQKTRDLRDLCHAILEEIHPATVRAVCYRLFVLKAIPDMSKNSTQKISRVLTGAREDGLIPWGWIVDETRSLERISQWDDPAGFAQTAKHAYRRDLWTQQPQRVEVWSEKGTMRGTLGPVLDAYGVGFRVMHGFGSATVVNDIAETTAVNEVPLRVFYIGDWDPSGMYMSEVDIPKRLDKYRGRVQLSRLALTAEDLRRPDLATTSFPASDKRKDPRYRWFSSTIGQLCWEVDALSPVVIRDRVEAAIVGMIRDKDAWTRYQWTEKAELDSLPDVLNEWARLKAS